MRAYQLFVLRVLIDPESLAGESDIRGSLQRIDQDCRLAFTDWQELSSLLQNLAQEQIQKQQQGEEQE